VVSTDGKDGVDERGQLVVHWPAQKTTGPQGYGLSRSGGVMNNSIIREETRLPSPLVDKIKALESG
jgi:hypothetical protein